MVALPTPKYSTYFMQGLAQCLGPTEYTAYYFYTWHEDRILDFLFLKNDDQTQNY